MLASSLNSNGTTRGSTEFVNTKVNGTLNFTFYLNRSRKEIITKHWNIKIAEHGASERVEAEGCGLSFLEHYR
jgi:hypothetical protein